MFCKKVVLKNFPKFLGKQLCQSLFFNKAAGAYNFIKKETLAQLFSCEFCVIFKNAFFCRTTLVLASANIKTRFQNHINQYVLKSEIFTNVNIVWNSDSFIENSKIRALLNKLRLTNWIKTGKPKLDFSYCKQDNLKQVVQAGGFTMF